MCMEKRVEFNMLICMTTYAYYLYMHLYPIQSVLVPAVVYVVFSMLIMLIFLTLICDKL